MKYYMIIIQNFNNGNPSAKAIYEYSVYDEALSTLYSTMVSALATEIIKDVTCLIMDEYCNITKSERWERTVQD